VQYNSRGVGKSSGWPSFTGSSEARDLEAVVPWLMQKITNVHTVVIVVRFSIRVMQIHDGLINHRDTRMERS
jgi:alpha/beta superfamily hydrolase